MPGRNPFLIAKEYLQPGESPQVRKNALTALAVLDDTESYELLAEKAVTESEPEVRNKARDVIASMPGKSSQQVLTLVARDLEAPRRQRAAYALLGELRDAGLAFDFPALPLTTRLRLAKAMRNYLYPKRGITFYLRTLKGVSFGTLLAWLFLSAVFFGLGFSGVNGDDVLALFYGWLLALAIAIAATFLTSPARFYADWSGGALLDMGIAALAFLGAAIIVALISIANKGPRPYLLLVSAPLIAASVRAGTLATFGFVKRKGYNKIVQTVTGGTCGLAVYELALLTAGKTGDDFFAKSWMWIVLASYGVAAAFAWIDSGSVPRPVTPRYATATAVVLTLLTLIFILVQLIPLPPSPTTDLGKITINSTDEWTKPFDPIKVRQVPATYSFTVSSAAFMEAKVQPERFLDASVVGPDGKELDEHVALQPASQYKIVITRNVNTNMLVVLPEFVKSMSWSRFRARITRKAPASGRTNATLDIRVHP